MRISKKYIPWFSITILITFHLINNYIWLKQDCESIMECCDVVHHTNITVLLHQELKDALFSKANLIEKLRFIISLLDRGGINWPPLVHLVAASIAFVSKDILFWIRFSNMLYSVILLISIYLLGKKIYSPNAGVISAYLISFYPAVFGLSRKFGLDFPLTAVVCLTLYFLFSCDEFRNRWYTVMFGISLGLAMLVKPQCIIFIIGPLLYTVLKGVKSKRHKINYILNILISVSLAVLISSRWRFKLFDKSVRHFVLRNFLLYEYIYANTLLSGLKIGAYLFVLNAKGIILNISPIFSLIALTGLFFYLRKLNKSRLFVVLWLFVPYFIFSFILLTGQDNEYRHLFPAYGAIALISAIGWLESPMKKNIKIIFISLFMLLGIYQFFILSYYSCYPFIDYRNAHPPEKNNHRLIMDNFNRIIQNHDSANKNIAIIEERYFRNDKCVRLSYFLKILNKENTVFLSARGFLPTQVKDEFLSNVNNYEFLMAFSESSAEPDYSGLLEYSPGYQKESAIKTIEKFKQFETLQEDILLPEKIHIFLKRKNPSHERNIFRSN